jgi:ParB family chromosome partitioning protein
VGEITLSEIFLVQVNPVKLRIVTDPSHPLFDERALDAVDLRMAASVGAMGVLEPVIVTPADGKGIHTVIAGRQRVKALIKANEIREKAKQKKRFCPCIVREDSGAELEGIVITENEIRKDDPPMLKARKVKRFIDRAVAEHKLTEKDAKVKAALFFGLKITNGTSQSVDNYCRILSTTEKVQAAVDKGIINSTVALQWYKLPAEEQDKKVAEAEKVVKDGGKITVAKANPAKGQGRGEKSRARAGDMRKKDEVVKLLTSTIREWNELSTEQQAKDANGLRGYISVLGWMLHDEVEVDEDATDALKKKGSKKVVYLIPESCQ